MKKFEKVTILLPAMNETYSLRETVETIKETCEKDDIAEIIIILNEKYSTDECKNVAIKCCDEFKEKFSIYIHYQKKPYVGGAVQEGFDLAKGSHVILMSSDLETDPKLVPHFIEKVKEHPDNIITASRWMKGCGFKGYNKVKLICNFIFQKMISMLFGTKLTDMTYAYRIFPSDLMKKINWEEQKHPFFLETALKPLKLGVKFEEIPANWVARTEGESQNGFFDNFNYFKTVCHVKFASKNKILK